jgi:hypothetical protein
MAAESVFTGIPAPAKGGRMKSWDDWTHAERAIFISHLNQPHDGLDAAIKERDRKWGEREEERKAIQLEHSESIIVRRIK